jgi:hypothetical protein
MTTADDKETIAGRSNYPWNQYYLQPICAAPAGALCYYNPIKHYNKCYYMYIEIFTGAPE